MRKRIQWLLLIMVCCTLVLPGCRRKPIETESETETQSETVTEKKTEKLTEKATEKQSETQQQTTKRTTVTPNSTAQTPQTDTQAATTASETQPSETQAPQTDAASQQCPYCYNWFSTASLEDGSSEYSSHVAQEEAYIASQGGYDSSSYYTDGSGVQYAQCEYCFQWFSTAADASGYSPYADHIAAETAYAMQNNNEEYVQCPNCGNWVTQSEYNDHIANGW